MKRKLSLGSYIIYPFKHAILNLDVWDCWGTNCWFCECLKLGYFALTQKWYSNSAAKMPGDNNRWSHIEEELQFIMAEEKKDKRQRGRCCIAGICNKESCQNRSFTELLDMLFSFYNPSWGQERNNSKQTFGTSTLKLRNHIFQSANFITIQKQFLLPRHFNQLFVVCWACFRFNMSWVWFVEQNGRH